MLLGSAEADCVILHGHGAQLGDVLQGADSWFRRLEMEEEVTPDLVDYDAVLARTVKVSTLRPCCGEKRWSSIAINSSWANQGE